MFERAAGFPASGGTSCNSAAGLQSLAIFQSSNESNLQESAITLMVVISCTAVQVFFRFVHDTG